MPKRYILGLIIFLLTIAATIYFLHIESSYTDNFEITEGIVFELGDKSTSYVGVNGTKTTENTQAIVSFKVAGKKYISEGRGPGYYPRWKINQKVNVLYSRDNPELSRIDRLDELYFFTILGLFFTSAFIILGSINYLYYKITGNPFS